MPRTYAQTVNAAQMTRIAPTVDAEAGTMNVAASYVVGQVSVDSDGVPHFGSIPGAAVDDAADITVPLSTTLAGAISQLTEAIALQEDLDLVQGDLVLPPP